MIVEDLEVDGSGYDDRYHRDGDAYWAHDGDGIGSSQSSGYGDGYCRIQNYRYGDGRGGGRGAGNGCGSGDGFGSSYNGEFNSFNDKGDGNPSEA